MTTSFPGGIDSFVNPTASPPGSDKLSTPNIKHSTMHTNENDAIVAIETYLGQVGSVSSGTITGQLNNLTSVVSGAGSGGAAVTGSFLVLNALSGTAARVFTLGAGLSGADAGSGSTYTLAMYPTGVSSGTYTSLSNVTVNALGQILLAGGLPSTGLVRGAPLMTRTKAALFFAEYVSEQDRVYFDCQVTTGSWNYIDRTMDYPVQLTVFSGRTPGNWIYSTIITGMLVSNGAGAAFTCTVSGAIISTGFSLGMQGGCAIRQSVSGKTIYCNAVGNARMEKFDPATNTTTVLTGATAAAGGEGRGVAWVSGVDSVYMQARNSDMYKIACATEVVTPITGIGLNLSATGSLTYNLAANKVFGCGQNVSANKTWYLTPGTDVLTTLDFPAGFQGTNGAHSCISFGNYVYFSTDTTSPSVVLVLDAVNLTWKFPLGTVDSNTASMAAGAFMTGVLSEGVLYLGNSISGFYTYGRL